MKNQAEEGLVRRLSLDHCLFLFSFLFLIGWQWGKTVDREEDKSMNIRVQESPLALEEI